MDSLLEALYSAKNPNLQDLEGLPKANKSQISDALIGALAGVAGLPVDLASTVMRPFGYDVPPEEVYGSSEWIGSRLGADTDSGSFMLGQFASPDPTDAARGGVVLPDLIQAMTVFHGSPHKWDRVDLSKVGTGEGAQAFGHGLYVAESPSVANTYRMAGAWNQKEASTYLVDGKPYTAKDGDDKRIMHYAEQGREDELARLRETYQNLVDIPPIRRQFLLDEFGQEHLDKEINRARGVYQPYLDLIDRVSGAKVEPGTGHLYELDLPDEAIEKMLDWDKPLSEQPEAVLDVFRQAGSETVARFDNLMSKRDEMINRYVAGVPEGQQSAVRDALLEITHGDDLSQEAWDVLARNPEPFDPNLFHDLNYDIKELRVTGENLYDEAGYLAHKAGADPSQPLDKSASEYLRSLGIPGIKYLDGTSRTAGEGSRNYVVFDEQYITPLTRNGEPLR